MFLRAAAFRADAFAARFMGGVVGDVTPEPEAPDRSALGGELYRRQRRERRERRIKRETFHPRGPSLRELFEAQPPAPVVAPLPEPEQVVASSEPEALSRESIAPDLTPLLRGLESLRAAADAAALAQAIEDDDAEVLVLM